MSEDVVSSLDAEALPAEIRKAMHVSGKTKIIVTVYDDGSASLYRFGATLHPGGRYERDEVEEALLEESIVSLDERSEQERASYNTEDFIEHLNEN
jgi:hypothetical protein